MADTNTPAATTTNETPKTGFKDEAVQIVKFSTKPVRAKSAAIIALIALGIGAVVSYAILHSRHKKAMDKLYQDYDARVQEIGELKNRIENPTAGDTDRMLATLK